MAGPCLRRPVVAVGVLTLVLGAGACDSEGGGADTGARSGATGSDTVAAVGFDEIPRIAAEIEPSVVTVVVGSSGIGSGVVYREGGYVVTNAHVVRSAERVQMELADGTRTPAEVLATDEITDIAVLRTERRDLPPARFQTRQPAVGELVLAVGSPLGFQNSVTAGRLHRPLKPDAAAWGPGRPRHRRRRLPGNSGLPGNGHGEVVGINEAYIPPASGRSRWDSPFPRPPRRRWRISSSMTAPPPIPTSGWPSAVSPPSLDQAFGMGRRGAVIPRRGRRSGRRAGLSASISCPLGDEQIRSAEEFLGALRGTRPGQTSRWTRAGTRSSRSRSAARRTLAKVCARRTDLRRAPLRSPAVSRRRPSTSPATLVCWG